MAGVHIQQALHQGSASESELGKRKLHDDFVRMELEERAVRCEQMRIGNIENKIAAVMRFAEAMTMLDAEWKNDRQLVLQTQDVLKYVFFREYPDASVPPPPALGAAGAAPTPRAPASISIAQVASGMNLKLETRDAVQIDQFLGVLYKERYGTPPHKHDQFVDGAVRSVNSYTAKDTDLVEAAIRALVNK